MLLQKKIPIKAPKSPFDKSVIVSIFPRPIQHRNVTLDPGYWEIPAGSYENPTILAIGPSSWWKDSDDGTQMIEVYVSSGEVGASVVRDYVGSMLEVGMGEAQPGVFSIEGAVTPAELKTKYKDQLDLAREMQKQWFLRLVSAADYWWTNSNGNPRVIDLHMKLAAEQLNLKDKPWMKDFSTIQMVACKACGSLRNPEFPVCPTCRAVNGEVKDLKFAG